ncbi:MAG TPA: VCBS repeat-containing protein [Pyrinomonadaceae bacterium]|nr:VCBS repeat-containing protein [Pyrinomonadaceae bacterium]
MDKLIPVLWVLVVLTSGCHAQPKLNTQSQNALFAPAPGFPLNIGSRPNDIAVADLNKDGRPDFVTCNVGDTVTAFLDNGRGSFTPAPGSPIKTAAHLIALGDVNNDRNTDLALTHHDSLGVEVLLGAGDGRFTPAPGSPFIAHQGAKPHNHGLALSDLNSDGNLDITTSNQDDNSVSVLLGNGRSNFTPAAGSPFAVGSAPYPHAIGDVNRDGNLDIVTPNVGSNNVTVLLGDGRGGFKAAPNSPYAVASRPYYIAIGDVSGDGNPDLITTHDDINLITTLLGNDRGLFAAAPNSPFDVGHRAFKLIAADVTGDARMELVIGTEASDSVVVLLGNERGGYTSAAGSPYRSGRNPRVATRDMNGDGKPDIVTANNGSVDITLLLNR